MTKQKHSSLNCSFTTIYNSLYGNSYANNFRGRKIKKNTVQMSKNIWLVREGKSQLA